jgi:hypothetical protein
MEAEGMPDGRARLVITPHLRVRPPAYVEFDYLIGFLSEAKEGLWRKKDEFPARVGITFEEAQSLMDEILLVRYDVLKVSRHQNPHTGEFHGTTEVRETGTTWDGKQKIEASLLPDGRLTLALGRGELSIFANCVDVAVDTLSKEEFFIRRSMTPEEAEAFRDELRRLDRETRVKSSS